MKKWVLFSVILILSLSCQMLEISSIVGTWKAETGIETWTVMSLNDDGTYTLVSYDRNLSNKTIEGHYRLEENKIAFKNSNSEIFTNDQGIELQDDILRIAGYEYRRVDDEQTEVE